MTSAATELQRAVFASLTSDAALLAEMGGPHVYDHPPADVAFPYVTFGRSSEFDWSTATEPGSEHLFTINAWSKAKGRTQALRMADMVRRCLDAIGPAFEGHRIVHLRNEAVEMRFDDDLAVHQAMMRFRAVTEPTD